MGIIFFGIFLMGFVLLIDGLRKKLPIAPAITAVILGFGGMAYLVSQHEQHWTCKTIAAEVLELSSSDAQYNAGRRLVHITEIEDLSAEHAEVSCKGTGMWSDTDKTALTFKALQVDDQWFVQYSSR